MKQKTDREASQDNKSPREELGIGKVEINWHNCYSDEYANKFMKPYNHKFYKKWCEPQMLFAAVVLNIWKSYYFLYIFVWQMVTSHWEYKF